jgi:hypothetical protein
MPRAEGWLSRPNGVPWLIERSEQLDRKVWVLENGSLTPFFVFGRGDDNLRSKRESDLFNIIE